MPLDLERKRASFALDCINEIKKSNINRKEYRQHAQKLPSLIIANGLAQTLAFLESKGDVQKKLDDHLKNWLKSNESPVPWTSNEQNIRNRLLKEDNLIYMQACKEAIAFAGWLKRLSVAEIEG